MKHLIFLLLPLAGFAQAGGTVDTIWSSRSGIITPIYGNALSGIAQINAVELYKNKFNKIDTVYGIVEYLVAIDSSTYERKIVNGYKVDSVFSRMDIGSCPNPLGANISCAVLHYQTYYTRNTFQVVANGREINRYKYYTFIPKQ